MEPETVMCLPVTRGMESHVEQDELFGVPTMKARADSDPCGDDIAECGRTGEVDQERFLPGKQDEVGKCDDSHLLKPSGAFDADGTLEWSGNEEEDEEEDWTWTDDEDGHDDDEECHPKDNEEEELIPCDLSHEKEDEEEGDDWGGTGEFDPNKHTWHAGHHGCANCRRQEMPGEDNLPAHMRLGLKMR